jgi:hypothetical protein
MTEAEWLAATDAQAMVAFLQSRDAIDGRKLRLLVSACIWQLGRLVPDSLNSGIDDIFAHAARNSGRVPNFMSQLEPSIIAYTDACKKASPAQLAVLDSYANIIDTCFNAVPINEYIHRRMEPIEHLRRFDGFMIQRVLSDYGWILADVIGNPFRSELSLESSASPDTRVQHWNDGSVQRLAEDAFEHRSPRDGKLDTARVAMLADAVEDAGYGDADLLDHLRCPGPHVRECWALDRIMGRE